MIRKPREEECHKENFKRKGDTDLSSSAGNTTAATPTSVSTASTEADSASSAAAAATATAASSDNSHTAPSPAASAARAESPPPTSTSSLAVTKRRKTDSMAAAAGTAASKHDTKPDFDGKQTAAAGNGHHKIEKDHKSNGSHSHGNGNGNSSNGAAHRQHTVSLPATVRTPAGNSLPTPALIRLVLQSLQSLGCTSAVQALAAETGVAAEESVITSFRRAVRDGQWATVERLLTDLQISDKPVNAAPESSEAKIAPIDSAVASPLNQALFMIREQKFLELLELSKLPEALHCLRHEIAPVHTDTSKLHKLSSYVLYVKADEIRVAAEWDGASGQSRAKLLESLLGFVPATLALPSNRLFSLLDQAVAYQQSQASNSLGAASGDAATFSLLNDTRPIDLSARPAPTTQAIIGALNCLCVIESAHSDEILHVACSRSGARFATASKDRSVIVWEIDEKSSAVRVLQVLRHTDSVASASSAGAVPPVPLPRRHRRAQASSSGEPESPPAGTGAGGPPNAGVVWFAEWSGDDRFILTITEPTVVRVWRVATGECVLTVDRHKEVCSAAAWMNASPNNSNPAAVAPNELSAYSFVTAGIDRKIMRWDLSGAVLQSWPTEMVRDMAVSSIGPSSYQIVTVESNHKIGRIRVLQVAADSKVSAPINDRSFPESGPTLSLAVSRNGHYALVVVKAVEPPAEKKLSRSAQAAAAAGAAEAGIAPIPLRHRDRSSPAAGGPSRSPSASPPAPTATLAAGSSAGSSGRALTAIPRISLWDLRSGQKLNTFVGFKQERYIFRAAFGGLNDDFVISGSDDSQLYVWNRTPTDADKSNASGAQQPALVLSGHTAPINAVAVLPSIGAGRVFVTGSDDCTIRIWAPPNFSSALPTSVNGGALVAAQSPPAASPASTGSSSLVSSAGSSASPSVSSSPAGAQPSLLSTALLSALARTLPTLPSSTSSTSSAMDRKE